MRYNHAVGWVFAISKELSENGTKTESVENKGYRMSKINKENIREKMIVKRKRNKKWYFK